VTVAIIVVVAIIYALTRSDVAPPPPDKSGGVTAPTPSTTPPPKSAQQPGPPPRIEVQDPPEKPPVAPPDPQADQNARMLQRVDEFRKLAQAQFARGDLRQALTATIDGLKLQPDDPELKRLLGQALTDARARLRRARDTATAAGEPARRSSSYREAVKREQDVPRLERAGRSDEAIRSLWLAADLFAKATEEATRRSAARDVSPASPPPAAPPPVVESKPPPEQSEPTPPPVSTPPPQAPAPRPVAPPAPAQVAPESPAPVRSAPPVIPPTPVNEEPAIAAVLQAYADAYSGRDAAAVRRVYPTVNEQALRQFFSESKSYQVQIQDRQISVSGTEATVSCTWASVFEGEVGGRQRRAQKVVLGLKKSDGRWFIVSRR
jgi:ketosteroid isomerase-like protein